ncbi:MAG: hypothetical protein KF709_05450 [Gemmatimonadaceae bacterium]|nr:hypothetical protein [Gemmatimonadaceae bacterium]
MSPTRLLRTLAASSLMTLGACYQDPQQVMDQQQQLNDIADAINQMGLQMADMQATLDSLGGIIAKHDTAVYRMANVTGVPYQR